MKRWMMGAAALGLVLALAVPAGADEPDSFSACGSDSKGGNCTKLADVAYGETIYFKGVVDPPHSDLSAGVWYKAPFADSWVKWASVQISDKGVMKYAWETTIDDGAQDSKHCVQFRIKGHGKSNRVAARVWLGE
jgi:hypothetical protein